MGLRVLAISCVTNYCPNIASVGVTHEEVQEMADMAGEKMVRLIRKTVKMIGEE